jgi:hypothetical protein
MGASKRHAVQIVLVGAGFVYGFAFDQPVFKLGASGELPAVIPGDWAQAQAL